MNRNNALCIVKEDWMDEESFSEIIDFYEIEYSVGKCPQLDVECIWLDYHDENIFSIALGELNIISGLHLWLDDLENKEEICITESNHKAYDSDLFYKIRTGKYDPIEEI